MSERLNQIRKECEELIVKYNDAIKTNASKIEADNIEKEIKDKEKEFAQQAQDELFSACKATDDPILNAIKCYAYPIIRHKVDRNPETGNVTGISVAEDGEKQVNLVKLCTYCDKPTLWKYKVEKLGYLLTLRAAKELKLPAEDIARIKSMYKMDKKSREEELGTIPDSNNQICKLLQKVIDAILYEDNGSGKNTYSCNSHDVGYLLRAFTRKGKERLTIRTADGKSLHGYVMDVIHRIVTGGKYSLDYKVSSQPYEEVSKSEAISAPAKKESAPKKGKPTKAAKEPTEVATEVVEVERELPAAEVSESETIPA